MDCPKAPEYITTQRLILRRPEKADAEAIFSGWASDPAVTKYMCWPRHATLSDTLAFLAFSDEEWEQNGYGPYLIELKETHEIIGSTGLSYAGNGIAEVGYILNPKYWGHGFATEALRACIDIAPNCAVHELLAAIHIGNAASRSVVEKCNFEAGKIEVRIGTFPNGGTAKEEVVPYRLVIG